MSRVTLHDTGNAATTGLRVEDPHTGQVISLELSADALCELHAALGARLGLLPVADPHLPAVERFRAWRAERSGHFNGLIGSRHEQMDFDRLLLSEDRL